MKIVSFIYGKSSSTTESALTYLSEFVASRFPPLPASFSSLSFQKVRAIARKQFFSRALAQKLAQSLLQPSKLDS
jgi:hypothetical protein